MPTQRVRSGRIQEEVFSSSSSEFDDAPSSQGMAGRRQHHDNHQDQEEEEEDREEEGWYSEEEEDTSPSSRPSGERPDPGHRQRQATHDQPSGSKHQIELAYHALQEKNQELRRVIGSAEKEIKSLLRQKDRSEEVIEELRERAALSTQEAKELRKLVRAAEEDLGQDENLRALLSNAEHSAEEERSRADAAEEEAEHLRKRAARGEAELEAAQKRCSAAQEEADSMRRRLEASEAEEVALKARVQGTVEIEARLREAEARSAASEVEGRQLAEKLKAATAARDQAVVNEKLALAECERARAAEQSAKQAGDEASASLRAAAALSERLDAELARVAAGGDAAHAAARELKCTKEELLEAGNRENQLVRQVKAEVQARAASDRALEEAGKLREELELGLIEARGREERLERELAAARGDAESMRGKFEVMRRERDAAREQVAAANSRAAHSVSMARAEADRARVDAGECVRETDAYKRGIAKKLESLQVHLRELKKERAEQVQQLQEASRRASETQRALERERAMHEQTLSEVAAEHAREMAEQGWKASARARASPPPPQQQQSAVGGAIRCSFRVASDAIGSFSGWEQVRLELEGDVSHAAGAPQGKISVSQTRRDASLGEVVLDASIYPPNAREVLHSLKRQLHDPSSALRNGLRSHAIVAIDGPGEDEELRLELAAALDEIAVLRSERDAQQDVSSLKERCDALAAENRRLRGGLSSKGASPPYSPSIAPRSPQRTNSVGHNSGASPKLGSLSAQGSLSGDGGHDVEALRKQVVAAKKEQKRMQTTIGELMAMRDKRDKDTEEKKRIVETLEARVASLLKQARIREDTEKRLEAAVSVARELELQCSDLKARAVKAEEGFSRLRIDVRRKEDEAAVAASANRSLQQRASALEAHNEALRAQVRDVHGRLVAESDKRAACTVEIDFLQGRIEELQDGVQDLVTLTVALDELGPTFVESTKTVVEDRARLAAGARRLKMLADKRGKESSDREAVIGGLSEEVAEWEQRAEELILEVERLKEEDVAKSGEAERLEREVEEVKGELESARSMGAALQVRITELERQADESRQTVESLEVVASEVDGLRSKCLEFEERCATLESSSLGLKAKITQLEEELSDKTMVILRAEGASEGLVQQVLRLEAEVGKGRGELEEVRRGHEAARAALLEEATMRERAVQSFNLIKARAVGRSRREVERAEAARMATAFYAFVNQVRLDALALRLSESVNAQASPAPHVPQPGNEDAVSEDVQRLRETLAAMGEECEGLREALGAAEEENFALREGLSRLKESNACLVEEVASLKKALAAEEESASALRDAIVSSTPRPEAEDSGSGVGVDEARSKELASLRGERDAYRSQLDRVLRDMDIVRSQQSSVTSDRVVQGNVDAELEEARASAKDSLAQVDAMAAQLLERDERVSGLVNDVEKARSEADALRQDLAQARSDLDELRMAQRNAELGLKTAEAGLKAAAAAEASLKGRVEAAEVGLQAALASESGQRARAEAAIGGQRRAESALEEMQKRLDNAHREVGRLEVRLEASMRGQVAGLTDSSKTSTQGRHQQRGESEGVSASPRETSHGGRPTAQTRPSQLRSPGEMSFGAHLSPTSPRDIRDVAHGQHPQKEMAYGGVVPCSPLAVSMASSTASAEEEARKNIRNGSGEWAMTLHVIEARNLPHTPSSGVFACASLLASPASGGSAPKTLPEHALEVQSSEGGDGAVSPQLTTPSAHQSPEDLRVVWNSVVRLDSFMMHRANYRGTGDHGGAGWQAAPLHGQPVMVLVSVHAQRETMLGRLAVPMGTTDGALLDQWFELRARDGGPLRSAMGLPSELRLRVAYGQGDSLVEPSVLAHPSPRHLASPRHSPRVRSISPITSPRLLEPSPIVAGKALDSQQRDVHQPRRSSTSGDATEQFQNQKAMAVGEQMTAASPPFTGSIQGHGPDEGEYESEWVVRLRLEGHQDVAHVREESALKVVVALSIVRAEVGRVASECGKLDHVLGTVSVVSRIPGAIRISPQEIMGPLTYGGGCPPNNSRVALSTVRAFDRGESAEEPLDGEGVVAVLTVHVQDPEGRAASVGRSLIPLRPGDGGAQPLWIQLFTPTGANLLDGASKPSLLLVSASYTKRGAPTPDGHCILPAVVCIANHLRLLKSQFTGSGGAAATAPQFLKLPDGWRWQRSKTNGKVFFHNKATGATSWRAPEGTMYPTVTSGGWAINIRILEASDIASGDVGRLCCSASAVDLGVDGGAASLLELGSGGGAGGGQILTGPAECVEVEKGQGERWTWEEAGGQISEVWGDKGMLGGRGVALVLTLHVEGGVAIGRAIVALRPGVETEAWIQVFRVTDGLAMSSSASGRPSLLRITAAYGPTNVDQASTPQADEPCVLSLSAVGNPANVWGEVWGSQVPSSKARPAVAADSMFGLVLNSPEKPPSARQGGMPTSQTSPPTPEIVWMGAASPDSHIMCPPTIGFATPPPPLGSSGSTTPPQLGSAGGASDGRLQEPGTMRSPSPSGSPQGSQGGAGGSARGGGLSGLTSMWEAFAQRSPGTSKKTPSPQISTKSGSGGGPQGGLSPRPQATMPQLPLQSSPSSLSNRWGSFPPSRLPPEGVSAAVGGAQVSPLRSGTPASEARDAVVKSQGGFVGNDARAEILRAKQLHEEEEAMREEQRIAALEARGFHAFSPAANNTAPSPSDSPAINSQWALRLRVYETRGLPLGGAGRGLIYVAASALLENGGASHKAYSHSPTALVGGKSVVDVQAMANGECARRVEGGCAWGDIIELSTAYLHEKSAGGMLRHSTPLSGSQVLLLLTVHEQTGAGSDPRVDHCIGSVVVHASPGGWGAEQWMSIVSDGKPAPYPMMRLSFAYERL